MGIWEVPGGVCKQGADRSLGEIPASAGERGIWGRAKEWTHFVWLTEELYKLKVYVVLGFFFQKGCGLCGLATDVRPLTTSICAAEKEPQCWGVLKHQLPPQEGRDPVTDPVTPLASSALERHLLVSGERRHCYSGTFPTSFSPFTAAFHSLLSTFCNVSVSFELHGVTDPVVSQLCEGTDSMQVKVLASLRWKKGHLFQRLQASDQPVW